ncbi:MAG: hypothetical protein M3Z56_10530 [Bacteroidota bacterium]|nr:hypothetical protein [Bacteroidota bacterium]
MPLIQFVRDYAMMEFANYNLGDMPALDRFILFRNSIMGQFFDEKLMDSQSYMSGLIDDAISANGLDSIIKLGYEQVTSFRAE